MLWHEIVKRGREFALPPTIEEVQCLLVGMIEDVLEQDWRTLQDTEYVHHPERQRGGMSGGHVSITTWRARLIPLLLARAKALHDYSWSSEFSWARRP